ncbi:hypothetical protein JCM5296_002182 [Sporobolomyces johnsonii]
MARHRAATGSSPAQEKQTTAAEIKRAREVVLIKRCIAVTSVYMLAEIVIGYQFNALSLVADSFHMLNDLVAFIVQLYADEIGALKREHARDDTGFSYGFGRTQFVANLINGVLLLALCLTLALESMQRFYSPETMTIPPLVAGMGFLGLVWNVFMFFQFMHSHSDSGEAHSLAHPSMYRQRLVKAGIAAPYNLIKRASSSPSFVEHSLPNLRLPPSRKSRAAAHGPSTHGLDHHDEHDHHDEPLSALAIHAATDAAGNFAVIVDGLLSVALGPKIGKVSGLVTSWNGIGYVDPLASLVVVYVILVHSFPLVAASSYALMQAFDPGQTKQFRRVFQGTRWLPAGLSPHLRVELVGLHIWSLSKDDRVATVKFLIRHGQSHSAPSATDLLLIQNAAKHVFADVDQAEGSVGEKKKGNWVAGDRL